jgi:molecular chaperone DnaK (HSP70)
VPRAARVIGIDLGTTNTVVAHAEGDGPASVVVLSQLVAAADIGRQALLPSVLFAPPAGETPPDPWGDAPFVVGAYARARGQQTPTRAIASFKSWLSHSGVDRLADILPWGADASDATLPRVSPLEATRRALVHVRRSLEDALSVSLDGAEVILTVPASFDEVARELTVRAAEGAGLSVRLLEEPVAAFHDYLAQRGTTELESLLAVPGTEGRTDALALVCDVGGGTTDLTLIRVARQNGALSLDRVAVGRHLLLGGDNMDLALAHGLEPELVAAPARLDPGRFAELVQACRTAKERLLADDAPDTLPIRILSAGSALVGGTLSGTLSRAAVEETILDGFFPVVGRDATPVRGRSGFVAFGLPYEQDAAITRHVAAFLQRHLGEGRELAAVLMNGGVFRSPVVRRRIQACLAAWRLSPTAVVELAATDPELAVARGAVAFAQSLSGHGTRIGGGSARGYYVGLAATDGSQRALSIVPRGAREGQPHVVVVPGLTLIVGEPARFDLFSSDTATHAPGHVVPVDGSLDALPSMTATFESDTARGTRVPVHLEGELSAVGTLDVACVATEGRFRLAFDLRGMSKMTIPPGSSMRPRDPKLEGASDLLQVVFGKGRADADPRDARRLLRDLEKLLGERPTWTTETARGLFDALVPDARARKRSAEHERVFWMLAGYCLRPGYGHPLDERRVGRLVPLFTELVTFAEETRSFQQFWIAWRRVAGGLLEPLQTQIRDLVDPFLSTDGEKPKKRKGFKPLAEDEMLELASSLERLPVARRADLGRWIIERTWSDRDPRLWSLLARVGARVPTYASAHHVVPPNVVESWLDHLLREKWNDVPTAAAAAVQMARVTGDRTRDVAESTRRDVAKRLVQLGVDPEWPRAVVEHVDTPSRERAEFFGESLPVGLQLSAG